MPSLKKHWLVLGLVLTGTFTLLGFFGHEVYRQAPPIPDRVVTESGRVLMTRADILDGQQAWQSLGGQQVGSIWGHGAYQAPDWSADWLHREATALLGLWSMHDYGQPFERLNAADRAVLEQRLRDAMRHNSYDAASGTLTLSDDRAAAMATTAAHYQALFGGDPSLHALRKAYALPEHPLPDPVRREKLTQFFFWSAWACTTERPGNTVTYTNNWPHEPLVGNTPTTANVMWSILSIVLLLAGVGALVWYTAARRHEDAPLQVPSTDPLDALQITPSMRAVAKYCAVVVLLFVLQAVTGMLTAHYTVDGQTLYGIPLAKVLPYAVTRTWHVQLGIFWIATAFLATGLFLAPAVGGREPKYQRLGVNALFGALLLVVLGSMAGEWFAVQQKLGLGTGFWFGHQGYEYVDLGRAWQIALYAGLGLWLFLMLRALWPALRHADENRANVLLFAGAAAAIGLFYGSGLFYSARTHLSVMEYWRWWVVHLWVEGFMEVFATAAVAFLFSRMELIRPGSAARATLFATAIFLVGGIPGTFHHLYFSGTPVSIMAVGATFSALEVVPLVLIGIEALGTLRMENRATWMRRYRWPLRFFVGVAFWNLVGAGLFGFMINPPIALYYMQGLNTTAVHGHTALFGVYGLLSLGLVLVILRRLWPAAVWSERTLAAAFWHLNVGLALMVALSVLPVGLLQAHASIERGLWFARSAEFLQQPHMQVLRWLRMIGDTTFFAGVVVFVWFTLGVWRNRAGQGVPAVTAAPARPSARPDAEPELAASR
jgi:nitric oxide reductase subunit B